MQSLVLLCVFNVISCYVNPYRQENHSSIHVVVHYCILPYIVLLSMQNLLHTGYKEAVSGQHSEWTVEKGKRFVGTYI